MGYLTLATQVYRENENAPLGTAQWLEAAMALNSTMKFVMDWNNRGLEADQYRLEVPTAAGQNAWNWQEVFEIGEESEALNEEAIVLDVEENNNWVYILGILLSILVIFLVLINLHSSTQEK